MPTRALLSLSALRPLTVGRQVLGSAVGNARRSLDEISVAVQDRRRQGADLVDARESGDLQRLSSSACLELLATRSAGRLAYVARAGTPDLVPVNYLLDNGTILIRSGAGPKLQAAERRSVVAFEVDDIDEQTHTGWSVVVIGRAERLSNREAALLAAPQPWANGSRHHLMRIQPTRIEGRQLVQ
jgi:nitroimidazol reductase NimA-like FMN-containing flavoprotein (pyridoxamine 5'-phosphate oxidase superfamily)